MESWVVEKLSLQRNGSDRSAWHDVKFAPEAIQLTLLWPRCAAASTARNQVLRQREAVFRDIAGRVYQTRPLRLCSTQCSMFSSARSRAAGTTNLARSSHSLVLRALFGGAKSLYARQTSAPDRRLVTRRQPNSAPDRGHLMA